MGPVEYKIGNFAEESPIIPQRPQAFERRRVLFPGQRPGTFQAKQGRIGGFGVFLVTSLGFSQGRGIALDVQYVVGNLKGQTNGACVGVKPSQPGRIDIRRAQGTECHRRTNQGPGFARVHVFESGQRQWPADRIEIDGLTAGHAGAARCLGELGEHVQTLRGFDDERRIARQQFECECLQGVARQYRCGFIERFVAGGFAAPQVVVVHGWQVVMHQ